jgi:ribokinase
MRDSPPVVAVVGSINRDIIIRTHKFPAVGETVVATSFSRTHGGKGANQAIAAARCGQGDVAVALIGAVGGDAEGHAEVAALKGAGVNVDFVARVRGTRTGTAFITVDAGGSNMIVVAAGANHRLSRSHVASALNALEPAVVLISLEISIEAVAAATIAGRRTESAVILNPAPFQSLPREIFSGVDVITPNEIEFRQLVDVAANVSVDSDSIPELIRNAGHLPDRMIQIVTLGERGAVLCAGRNAVLFSAPRATVVDTVGAGDSFNGALAASLAARRPIKESVQAAIAVAAMAVTVRGARGIA